MPSRSSDDDTTRDAGAVPPPRGTGSLRAPRLLLPLLLILLLPIVGGGGECRLLGQTDTLSPRPSSPPVVHDTTIVNPPIPRDSLRLLPPPAASPADAGRSAVTTRPDTGGYHPSKSAWRAVGYSALLPGLGQFYNENYWKIPLIWGLAGYWIYEWGKLNGKYKEYRDLYTASRTTFAPNGNGQYLSNRDFYRDERDRFAWYMGALYFLNLVDAYVGAQLYDFDVSPDLGADGRPSIRVSATLRVPF